jgi:dynein heavy chain 1
MLLVLPRIGTANDAQLLHLNKVFPKGGPIAMQALLNLMKSGVVDCKVWQRESHLPEAIGTVTGNDDDLMHLDEPVLMPPTAGMTLRDTETTLEMMLLQVRTTCEKLTNGYAAAKKETNIVDLAGTVAIPMQVILLLQRMRFTSRVGECLRGSTPGGSLSGSLMKELNLVRDALGQQIRRKDVVGGALATMRALQILLQEQVATVTSLVNAKEPEQIQALWKESARFAYDCSTDPAAPVTKFSFSDYTLEVGHEYCPGPILVTTNFTRNLRFAYLQAMAAGSSRCLVLVGPTGSGKTEHLRDVGRLLGLLPSTIRMTSNMTTDKGWWERNFKACSSGNGGSMAPVILTQADRAPKESLMVAKKMAETLDIAVCLTMSPGEEAEKRLSALREVSDQNPALINMPEPEMDVIAAGLLSSLGVKDADALATPLANLLQSLARDCSKQPHYDFGTRTLHQLCTQMGEEIRERAGTREEKKVLIEVIERCVMPRMTRPDMEVLQSLLGSCLGAVPPSPAAAAGPPKDQEQRWNNVVRNVGSITTVEPDCMVLPVQESEEPEFFKAFSRALNAEGAVMARMKSKLCDHTAEELLGTMPRDGEEVKEGILVALLRAAMENNEPTKRVWIVMPTGNCKPELWESLHELLNDSGCLNLATGEQLRLSPNLRYLFVMPNADGTSTDTFSRSAIVYTNPESA